MRFFKWKPALAAFAACALCGGMTAAPAAAQPATPRGADDGKALKIACVGASTTWGRQVASDKGSSWPSFLQEMLGDGADVQNFGYPGCSVTKGCDWSYIDGKNTDTFFQSMYQKSLDFKADVVIIENGGNDSQRPIWSRGTFEKDYEELVNAYRNQGNDPLIFIVTGGHCIESEEYVSTWGVPGKKTIGKWGEDDDSMRDLVQPAQERVAAKYGIQTADLRALLLSNPDEYICKEDGVHYTEAGYYAEAQMIYEAILPLISLPADKTMLSYLVTNTLEDFEGASPAAVAAYEEALSDAQTLVNNPKATQQQVDDAVAALQAAEKAILTPLGDVDSSGGVDTTDARLILQHAAGKLQEGDIDLSLGDVDGSGGVDTTDARLVLQHAAGKIDAFPAESK